MLEALALNINEMEKIVYVQLLGEGTIVYRPVPATQINGSIHLLRGEEIFDGDDEDWEFLPGTKVVVEERELGGEKVFVAIDKETTK